MASGRRFGKATGDLGRRKSRATPSARRRRPFAITHVSIGIERAHTTLRDAARFLGVGVLGLGESRFARAGFSSKVLGNGLRELDRFLSVLIDEVATAIGIEERPLGLLRTRRNTAKKLHLLNVSLGRSSPHHRRLRAVGRSRDCLFHCDGLVRRADSRGGSTMTAGWPARSSPLGSRLTVRQADLDDVCRFYERVADDLLALSRRDRPIMP